MLQEYLTSVLVYNGFNESQPLSSKGPVVIVKF